MTVDTLFICFCIDCEENDGNGRPYYMNASLMKAIQEIKKKAPRLDQAAQQPFLQNQQQYQSQQHNLQYENQPPQQHYAYQTQPQQQQQQFEMLINSKCHLIPFNSSKCLTRLNSKNIQIIKRPIRVNCT